jgi:hypothetical protein
MRQMSISGITLAGYRANVRDGGPAWRPLNTMANPPPRSGWPRRRKDGLAHPSTDRIAGVARRSAVDRRAPIGGVVCHMRRHVVLAQVGDKLGHIIGLVGPEHDPMIARAIRRSAVPVVKVSRVPTTRACRFSITTCPR